MRSEHTLLTGYTRRAPNVISVKQMTLEYTEPLTYVSFQAVEVKHFHSSLMIQKGGLPFFSGST